MPLKRGRSKKAFAHNVSVEYRALRKRGKTKAQAARQAVAIAFTMRRKSKR